MASRKRVPRLETPGKLPPYAICRKMILEDGYSYKDLARKYGLSHDSVYHTIKRRARAHGDPWPLQSLEVRERKKRAANARKVERLYVNPLLIRLDLQQYRERTGLTIREIAEGSGVSASSISNLLNQRHTWMKREVAYKLSKYLARRDRPTVQEMNEWRNAS